MPIYEYKCSNCGEKVELIQKLGAKAPNVCPNCNAVGTLKKIISNTSFELKGSGWYATGYEKAAKSEKPKQDKTIKKDSGKGEKKNVGTNAVNH